MTEQELLDALAKKSRLAPEVVQGCMNALALLMRRDLDAGRAFEMPDVGPLARVDKAAEAEPTGAGTRGATIPVRNVDPSPFADTVRETIEDVMRRKDPIDFPPTGIIHTGVDRTFDRRYQAFTFPSGTEALDVQDDAPFTIVQIGLDPEVEEVRDVRSPETPGRDFPGDVDRGRDSKKD